MEEEVWATIKQRASCRKFLKDFQIDSSLALKLIQAAIEAPSAGNCQPWFFYLVFNHQLKVALAEAAYNQSFIVDAPLLIVVCADEQRSSAVYGRRAKELYVIQDCAAAIENILLLAEACNLNSCWIGAFAEERVKILLGTDFRPLAILAIGKKAQRLTKPVRRKISQIVKILK